MRLNYFIVVVGVLLCTSVYAKGVGISDCENDGLKGSVHKLWVKVENYINQNGRWIKEKQFDLPYKAYDEQGYLIEFSPHPPVSVTSRFENKYDAEGRIIESKLLEPSGGTSTFTYKTIGDTIEKVKHTSIANHHNLDSIDVFNKNNRLIETKGFRDDGPASPSETYSYDSQGRMIEKNTYDANGSVMSRSICNYDAEGRIIQCINSGPSQGKVVYDYPAQGTETQTTYNADGAITSKATFTYEYDSRGNWIKKIELRTLFGVRQFETRQIFYRTITYYPSQLDH